MRFSHKRKGYPLARKSYRTRYLSVPHSLEDARILRCLTAKVYRGPVRGSL